MLEFLKNKKKLILAVLIILVALVILFCVLHKSNESITGVYQIDDEEILLINDDGSFEIYDDEEDYRSGGRYSSRGIWEMKDDTTIEFTYQSDYQFYYRKYGEILISVEDYDAKPKLYSSTVPKGRTFYLRLNDVHSYDDYVFDEDGTCTRDTYYKTITYSYYRDDDGIYIKDSFLGGYKIAFYIYDGNHLAPKSEVAVKYKG